jgi:hypothetical protein
MSQVLHLMAFHTMGMSLSGSSRLVKFRACLYSLIFNTSTDINVEARAISIRSGIPNAIFRLAQQHHLEGWILLSKVQRLS